jgi:VCBS repeat-containing protein
LNFAGKFDPNDVSAHSGGHVEVGHHHGTTDTITIPDANLLFTGDFKRSGTDLILSKDGHDLVVQDYFKGAARAALASPDGAQLSGSIVDALTGHVEYAQAGAGPAAATVIGHVTRLAGSATAIRNGVSIELHMGDNVNKGDVVQAASDSSLGLTFIDGTVFGLSANARMVLNEMVYDPNGSSNSSLLSLVQGTITFVAGETAKHGDMKVNTPVATMGIRGTAVLVEIDFQVPGQGGAPPVKFQVLVEPGGRVGDYLLYSLNDPNLAIGQVNQAGQVTSVNGTGDTSTSLAPPLSPAVQLLIQETFQLSPYFPNYVPPNPNPRSTGPSGSTPANPPPTNPDPDPLKLQQPDAHGGQPKPNPINFVAPDNSPDQGGNNNGNNNIIPNATLKFDVTNVVDQTSFKLADHVTITPPNSGNVAVHDAHVLSALTQATVPTGINLVDLVTIDPQTETVTYDPAKFAFLGAGQTAVYVIQFDSTSGGVTVTELLTLTIDGVKHTPAITNANIVVAQGGAVVLHASDIIVVDPDSTHFTFTVSNVTHGSFQTTTDGVHWIDATTFTTDEVNANHVRFLQDGSAAAPTFSIQADDGAHANHVSNVLNGSVDFTAEAVPEPPTVTLASTSLAVNEETGSVALGISVAPHDSDDTVDHVTISGVPSDATLTSASDPGGISYNAETHSWTVAPGALADLKLNAGEDTTATLHITATTIGPEGATSAEQTISLTVNPVPEPPTVTLASTSLVINEETGSVALGIRVATYDSDETVDHITITGVPSDATLTSANDPRGISYNATNRSWTVAPAALSNLMLNAGEDTTTTLHVTATTSGPEAATSADQTLSLTVNEVAATITATNGGFTELAGVTTAPDIAYGTISFSEANLAVSTTFASFDYVDAQHHNITSSLTETQRAHIQAVESSLAVTPTAGNTHTGSATWSYSLADSHFDFLAAGETLTLTYTASVDDDRGGVATTPLTVTITGTNDVPVVAATSVATGAIGVTLPTSTSALTLAAAAILTAPSGLISGLGTDTGYGTLALAPNDDNSSGAINITSVFGSAGIDFFGTHYTSLYINNNGNITFGAPNGAYTPTAINAGFHNPIIAPFWADVDTRGQGAVYYDEDAADGVMTITWDHVGYYGAHTDKLDSFQIALINEGNGNFDILYRYGQMQWTTGDASGGSGGLGGTAARAGYSAGDGVHYFELPQSGNQSALLALPATPGNTRIAGVDEFQVRNGVVGPTTVTTSGTINFSDPDLTDTHSIKSVTYTGGATQLGTLAVTLARDTTGTGINGQFAWTYTADTAAVQAALLYTNDGSQIATFDVVIDDGHGGIVTQTVAVTLTASNADVWNGHGGNASWNTPGNWSLAHAPNAADVAYVDTNTLVSLDVSHLSDSTVAGLHVSSQGEIDLKAGGQAGSFAVDGALINLGTIKLTDNTTLEAIGPVHNSGTITIDAALTAAAPGATLLMDGTVVLDGGGTVTLDGTNDRITGTHGEAATSTLENVNNVINGFGKLGDDDHLHLVNDARGIIDATGLLTLDTDHTITNSGLLEASTGGMLVVDDAVAGTGSETIGNGGILEFASSVASTQTLTFTGSTGTLKLDDATHFAGQIKGLADSDGIDLAGFDADAKITRLSTKTSTVLTVTDEHHTAHNGTAASITLLGDYTDSAFTISNDLHGGVLIVDPPAPPSSTTVTATGINQTLTGTGPSDNFVFDFANVGQATITNFHVDTDLLQIKSAIFANAQAILDATHDDGHGNAVVALDAHDSITLAGVTKAQLHQTDFHLV